MLDETTRLRTLDAIAASTPRSAAGSSTVIPPATFTNTSSPSKVEARTLFKNREQEGKPLLVQTAGHPTSVSVGARADERLNLDQNRARSFDGTQDRRPGCILPDVPRRNIFEGLGTGSSPDEVISNTPSSLTAPKRFFDGADDTMGVVPLAFEVEDRIDDVLERLRPGQAPVFRHVSHYECRNVLAFRREQQLSGGFADLSDAARW